jgi:hypothetical protein
MRIPVVFLAAMVSACAPEPAAPLQQSREADVVAAAPAKPGSTGSLPDPPPPPPPRPDFAGLLPLTQAQIAEELGSGASCQLVEGDQVLMVAMIGDAIANDRGRVVHLKREGSTWNALFAGGSFTSEGLTIEVEPGFETSRQEEVIERDTSLTVKRGRRGLSTSHGPKWVCGS